MNIGIIGAGSIAVSMAKTIKGMENAECYAIASRTLEKAEKFAYDHGFKKAYGSYEQLVKDESVDLVYIATPHSEHYDNAMLCIENGKAVLCEKAFTVNAEQAVKLKKAASKRGVFITEAIWTRYMPSRKVIDDLLASGIIGKADTLTANLSYVIHDKKRLTDPSLAGGALLDIGIYGINFALMHFGKDIDHIDTSVKMTDTGVDGRESISIHYKDGKLAVLTHSIYSRSDRKGMIHGDKGYIVVENINNPSAIDVFDTEDRLIKHIDLPKQITGYEYEVYESLECIKEGRTESRSMPLDETIHMMEIMDGIRKDWGLIYPIEK